MQREKGLHSTNVLLCFQPENIYKSFQQETSTLSDRHQFFYKTGFCFEDQGLCFLKLCFLYPGYNCKPRPFSDAELATIAKKWSIHRVDNWDESIDVTGITQSQENSKGTVSLKGAVKSKLWKLKKQICYVV